MSLDWTLESGTVIRHDLLPNPSVWKLYCWHNSMLFPEGRRPLSQAMFLDFSHCSHRQVTCQCGVKGDAWMSNCELLLKWKITHNISLSLSLSLRLAADSRHCVIQVSPEGYATCNNGTRKSVEWLHSAVLVPWRRCCYITLTSALWIRCPVLHVDQQALVSRVGKQTSC